MGPRTWDIVKRLRGRDQDERGAEMVEFAFVVVLLIMLLYGIVTYGLILSAQSTLTQAAADAARSGIVSSSTAVATAEAQACTDVGWMDKTCVATPPVNPAVPNPQCPVTPASGDIVATACEETCPSSATNTCLEVTVQYNYSTDPLFPELPGFGLFVPSTLSSTNVLQISTPSN